MTYQISIDNAGRVVIPKSIRDRLRLSKGTTLELSLEEDHLVLRVPVVTGGALSREDGMLIVASELTGPMTTVDDIRDRRHADLMGL